MAALALAVERWLLRLQRWEEGQGLVEYTLILVLVSIVAVAAVTNLGTTIITRLYTLGSSF